MGSTRVPERRDPRQPSSAAPPSLAPWSGAYTLVELLIVVTVISTLAVAAVPALSSALQSAKITALARETAADMRYAQMLAVKTGLSHRILFSVANQAYEVHRLEGGNWVPCSHPLTKKSWRRELKERNRNGGVTLKEVDFGGGQAVTYDKYGAPASGGYVRFALNSAVRTIRVAPLSGRVTVE